MKFLSIDFSTTSTGYAFEKDGVTYVGSIGSKAKNVYERTEEIIQGVSDMIEEYNIEDYFVAIEEPIITFKNRSNINLIRCNGMFLEAVRQKFNMGFVDVPNSKWASFNLIKGKRAERKESSIDLLRQSGLVPEEQLNDDMADAYGIHLYMKTQGGKGC